MSPFHRIHLVVLDSVGIGEAPDAAAFGDAGADTLGHIARACGGLRLPTLAGLGLSCIRPIEGVPVVERPRAFFGKMREASHGKDTMTGHWELMGLRIDAPFRVFADGFPAELIARIEGHTGRRVLGNKAASGTEIIEEYGEEHLRTGALIVYTSADSVLQIAAHEEVVSVAELHAICAYCRGITLEDPYMLGRIIARPFVGSPGAFRRTANRHDYALKPFGRTTLDALKEGGCEVVALGKVNDIYDGEGVTRAVRTQSNRDGMDRLVEVVGESFRGLSFLNLVDFDAVYGHRRDPVGYGKALEEFDEQLAGMLPLVGEEDLLLITADHGNDPTHHGTDHTREYVPLLAFSPRFASGGASLGERAIFADVGATIAENFGVESPAHGASFLRQLR